MAALRQSSKLVGDAERTRLFAENAGRILISATAQQARSAAYIGYVTLGFGLLTSAFAALQAAGSTPIAVTIVSSVITTAAALADKIVEAARKEKIPALTAAAIEFSDLSSDLAQLIARWGLDMSRDSWDEAKAQQDYFPLKKKLDTAFAQHGKLGLQLDLLPTCGPRSGTGFEDVIETSGTARKWQHSDGTGGWTGNPNPAR